MLEESGYKSIQSRGFIRVHLVHHLFYFLLCDFLYKLEIENSICSYMKTH
jgi:hypothetical protein